MFAASKPVAAIVDDAPAAALTVGAATVILLSAPAPAGGVMIGSLPPPHADSEIVSSVARASESERRRIMMSVPVLVACRLVNYASDLASDEWVIRSIDDRKTTRCAQRRR